MITDYYYKTAKRRVKETIKEQDTPQDKEGGIISYQVNALRLLRQSR
jgi:hypothetical protein